MKHHLQARREILLGSTCKTLKAFPQLEGSGFTQYLFSYVLAEM